MFSRLEGELKLCEQHLTATDTKGSPVERVFVGYILTVAYAEFEKAIKNAVYERCQRENDPALNNYIRKVTDRRIRSIKLSELAGILKQFGDKYSSNFHDAREKGSDSDQVQTFWHNLLDNRHAIAHDASVSANYTDIQEWIPKAQKVITMFREALELSN